MILQSGGDNKTLPDKRVSDHVTLRVEDLTDALVYINLGQTASATAAVYFLGPGDAVKISKCRINNANEINLISIGSPNPKIFIDIL